MTTCGYFGVIIPDYDYYQGFFLHEEATKVAPKYLKSLRKDIIQFSEVRNPTPGVSDADQSLLEPCAPHSLKALALIARSSSLGLERLFPC